MHRVLYSKGSYVLVIIQLLTAEAFIREEYIEFMVEGTLQISFLSTFYTLTYPRQPRLSTNIFRQGSNFSEVVRSERVDKKSIMS